MAPELDTPRLILRQWRDSDRAPFAQLNANREVMRYFPNPLDRAASDALAQRIRQGLATRSFGLWAVEVRGGAPFIGFVGLSEPSFEAPFMPCVEIGWRLDRAAWGHGYATEAAQAALRHAFDTVQLQEVVSFTAVINQPSRAVMERISMTHDPSEDFDHPLVPAGSPLKRHVLYRVGRR